MNQALQAGGVVLASGNERLTLYQGLLAGKEARKPKTKKLPRPLGPGSFRITSLISSDRTVTCMTGVQHCSVYCSG